MYLGVRLSGLLWLSRFSIAPNHSIWPNTTSVWNDSNTVGIRLGAEAECGSLLYWGRSYYLL